jgi:hypothetical protein
MTFQAQQRCQHRGEFQQGLGNKISVNKKRREKKKIVDSFYDSHLWILSPAPDCCISEPIASPLHVAALVQQTNALIMPVYAHANNVTHANNRWQPFSIMCVSEPAVGVPE